MPGEATVSAEAPGHDRAGQAEPGNVLRIRLLDLRERDERNQDEEQQLVTRTAPRQWRRNDQALQPTHGPTLVASRPAIPGQRLEQDLALALVVEDLALDPLERVVDRLCVAPELFGHQLVGAPLEVETERIRLER